MTAPTHRWIGRPPQLTLSQYVEGHRLLALPAPIRPSIREVGRRMGLTYWGAYSAFKRQRVKRYDAVLEWCLVFSEAIDIARAEG